MHAPASTAAAQDGFARAGGSTKCARWWKMQRTGKSLRVPPGNRPTFSLNRRNLSLTCLSMLPTVCQACGGPIEHRERGNLANPNVCDNCALAWEEDEETVAVSADGSEADLRRQDDAGDEHTREAV